MMLKTGISGFTFLEVMVATAVLALGAVLIYEAFFISLDSYNYYVDYFDVAIWADDMLWQAQAKLRQGGSFSGQQAGEFTVNNKLFNWDLNYNLLDEQAGLFSIDLSLFWKTGKKGFTLSRNTYGMVQQE